MKELVEILARIKEIEVLVRDGKATEETEAELDELLERKKVLEEKMKKMNEKFRSAEDIDLPENEIVNRDNKYSTVEYRKAFKEFITNPEKRADATTATTDVADIIPTTIVDQVIEELKDYGYILPLVNFTNYPGGVEIPIAGTKPTASWVAEGSVADKQKKTISGTVTFNYYKLQMRVAITLVAATVSLEAWERMVAANIAEAMGSALEEAVFTGSGSGQPLGITNDTRLDSNLVIEFGTADATYDGWVTKLIGKLPLAYRKKPGNVIFMNPTTFDKYVQGLVDSEGHPIARTNQGLAEENAHQLIGKQVILTEYLPDLDSAVTTGDTIFCVYGNLENYHINSNLELTLRQYFDEDTDEYVRKATLIADGKLGDVNGLVALKTATVAG